MHTFGGDIPGWDAGRTPEVMVTTHTSRVSVGVMTGLMDTSPGMFQ